MIIECTMMFISKSLLPFSYLSQARSVFVAFLKLSYFSPQVLVSARTQHFCLGIRFSERDMSREHRQKRACRLNMTRWMPGCRAQGRFQSFANYSIKKRVTRSSGVGVSKLRQFNDFDLNSRHGSASTPLSAVEKVPQRRHNQ